MHTMPKFQLSRLRDIGWSKWDPIGLGALEDDWPVDEYDTYLLEAAAQLWRGQTTETTADYLVTIETEHMGLNAVPSLRPRAEEVARLISEYVETLRK